MCFAKPDTRNLTNKCSDLKNKILANHKENIDKLNLNHVYNEKDFKENDKLPYPEIDFSLKASSYYDTESLIEYTRQHLITDNIKILNWNCNGILSKINELKALITLLSKETENKLIFDVICLQETKLEKEEKIDIEGYNFIGSNRDRYGGGIGILVLKKYKTIKLKEVDSPSDDLTAQWNKMWLPGKPKNYKIIGNAYRPQTTPTNAFIDQFEKQLEVVNKLEKETYICGDYNIDIIKSNYETYSSKFMDKITSNSFLPLITRPTRVKRNSATLIDNILTNNFNDHHAGILTVPMSDHYLTFAIGKKQDKVINSKKFITKRNFSEKNIDNFCKKLDKENLNTFITQNEPFEQRFDSFNNKITDIFNETFPEVKVKYNKYAVYRPNEPWITKGIIQSIYNKDKMYAKMMSIRNEIQFNIAKSKFITYRNKLKQVPVIRFSKKRYHENLFEKANNDMKRTWQIIKKLINKTNDKLDLPDKFKIDGIETENANNIANAFNTHYSKVGSKLAAKLPSSEKSYFQYLKNVRKEEKSLFFKPVTEEDVLIEVMNLKNKDSSGIDNISNKLLKKVIFPILQPLTELINQSTLLGIVPNSVKIAKVIPIYKQEDENLIKNYRPISLLISISKILEKIVYKQLYNFVKDKLHSSQYGYRRKHSTEHALLELNDRILQSLDNGELCMGIFIDLSKAFDTLDHQILIEKLRHYGVRGTPLNWFKSYLTNRRQYVEFKGNQSETKFLTHGVPQGSILGPLLFLIYINDLGSLSEIINSILFADDTNLIVSHILIEQLYKIANSEMHKLNDWLLANKLSLNYDKTKGVFTVTNQIDFNLKFLLYTLTL